MMKPKAILAGTIALTLTLGGGGLYASQYASAATNDAAAAKTEAGDVQKERAGKRGGFGHGFGQVEEQLLAYLGLEEAALRTKLETMTLAEVAAEQGKTREELQAKLVEWLEAAQQPEAPVDADAAAADKPEKPAAAAIAEKLLDAKGFGFGKHGGGGMGGKGGFGGSLDAVAGALGLTADELRTELTEGKTIAAVAEAKGVAVQTVIDAIVSERKAKLDEELAAGTITQEQYDEKLAAVSEHAAGRVNGTLPARGKGGKGPRGAAPEDAAADESAAEDATA
ncbi:hypothetical protein [Paenibacillus arenilitoris]|uniref:SHOCT domain-containing protein n=1 Tax=Paenibacillus arenilitoris TaxID=2772299 RepID=A0A927CKI6_9BACL|nr:hypothetical protein [Paenibacillus arenilitoris]MBD2868268.1 hypothetical protein [Paenibacillus arenilitoris]